MEASHFAPFPKRASATKVPHEHHPGYKARRNHGLQICGDPEAPAFDKKPVAVPKLPNKHV